MKQSFIAIILLIVGLASSEAANYSGIYMTVSGSLNSEAKTVTLEISRADILDGSSHIVDASTQIDRVDVYRNEGHGEYQKVGEFSTFTVVNSLPTTTVRWTDTNLPTPTSGSTLVSYMLYAYIGSYKSQGTEAGSYNIDYRDYPNPVSNLKVVLNEDQSAATVSFTAPTHYTNGKAMTSMTSIKVEKYRFTTYEWKLQKTFRSSTAKPGAELSWEDTNIADDTYLWYRVIVYVGSEETTLHSEYQEVHTFRGEDTPKEVQALTGKQENNVNIISWEAPSEGQNGGFVDAGKLYYTIQRSVEGGQYTTLSSNCQETSFTDTKVLDHAANYIYLITACNSLGCSGTASVSIYAGAPYTMPFEETVKARSSFDKTGWRSTTVKGNGSGGWTPSSYVADLDHERYIYAPDNGGIISNMLQASNKNTGRFDYLLSAPIQNSGSKTITIEFDYYGMSGYDNILLVETSSDENEFTEAGRIEYSALSETAWAHFSLNTEVDSDIFYVRIVSAKGIHSNSVALDNLVVKNAATTGLDNISAFNNSGCYNILGQRVDDTYRGIVIKNGKKSLQL